MRGAMNRQGFEKAPSLEQDGTDCEESGGGSVPERLDWLGRIFHHQLTR